MPFLPFIPFNDCIDVVFEYVQQSVPWFVTMGFKSAFPVNISVLNVLAGVLDTWYTSDGASLMSANCAATLIKLTDLTSSSGPTVAIAPTTTAGTRTGAVLPAQSAMVVSLITTKRGRSFRGRNFWSGRVNPDQQTVTTWTASAATDFDNAYASLLAQTSSNGFDLSVLSRYENGVRRTVGVDTAVVVATAKTQMATQRKRLV